MSKFLSALWQKIKHPVRTEAAVLFGLIAGAVVAGLNYMSDHLDDVHWLRGEWKLILVPLIAGVITRFKVWSEKTVDEIEGGDEPHPV